jgi:signal transduction histidine kinase
MASPIRSSVSPDSARSTVAVAELGALVDEEDRAVVDAHVGLVTNAPGPALFVWGPEAICLAFNRHFRALSGMRPSSLGRPLFKAQPELERGWRLKIEYALAGSGATIDGSAFQGGAEGLGGDQQMGWLVPVSGVITRGALAMFMDASAQLEPVRRMVGAVAHDLREPLIGIQVVSERLSRMPKPTRERCVEDMERVIGLTQTMDRLIDDMGSFARRVGGGSRLSPRLGDLGVIVREACEKVGATHDAASSGVRPVRVHATEVPGLWDERAINQMVTALVASARQSGPEGSEVAVEVTAARESAVISIKDDGPGMRTDELDQLFEPWKRGGSPAAERRRRGAALSLFLARELVNAHGGKVMGERPTGGGFMLRVVIPMVTPGVPSSKPRPLT